MSKENVVVEIVGPDSKPPISLSWQGQTGYGHFTPREPGEHQVCIIIIVRYYNVILQYLSHPV